MSDVENILLIVPAEGTIDSNTMPDESFEDQGIVDNVRRFIHRRNVISENPEEIRKQIKKYIAIIRGIASENSADKDGMKLSEITLSLTLSAKGDIGIAATSAEAGIKLVFKQD